MLFNSFDFLIFFPIVVLVFLFIPKRLRSIWLLVASYYFYMGWNPKYALLIAFSTLVTFLSGIFIEKANTDKRKKIVVALSLAANLLILAVFKYANFALSTLSTICTQMGIGTIETRLDLLLPVGISFYTFQALGYTIDVYRGDIEAEKNFINYALFVSFFPQLVAGPIERSGNLLRQMQKIKELQLFDYERVRDGLMLMVYGFFQKLVIADRASILVNQVYNNYKNYGFLELSIATILFSFQVYCDFAGYTNIARGAAKVMGFSLMDNFRQPYLFSTSVKDYWSRNHISLTTWFTDYLYIPLGGSRKGLMRKYINILIVFTTSGLWHGASWNFVVWGGLQAVFIIAEDIKSVLQKRFTKFQFADTFSRRLRKRLFTFVLIDFSLIFFAANSFRHAIRILRQMLTDFHKVSLLKIGLDRTNWIVMILSLVVLFVVDLLHEKGLSIQKSINAQEIWFRTLVYLAAIWSVIMLGIYGVGYDASQFIYFQF